MPTAPPCLPASTTPLEAFRKVFEANVLAPCAVTEALLPLLQAAPAGRIVNHMDATLPW